MVVNGHRWSSALFLFVDVFKSGYLQQLDTWGMDGEVLQIMMPSEQEVYKLVSTSEKYYKTFKKPKFSDSHTLPSTPFIWLTPSFDTTHL